MINFEEFENVGMIKLLQKIEFLKIVLRIGVRGTRLVFEDFDGSNLTVVDIYSTIYFSIGSFSYFFIYLEIFPYIIFFYLYEIFFLVVYSIKFF